jgi:HAMP domain-containing protein
MTKLRDISLRRKQTLIIMLTSSAVLLLACAAFVTYDVFTFRRELVESASSLAEVVGNNTTAAIDFNDPTAAEKTLAALRGEPNIVRAHVHTLDGRTFATYSREGTRAPPEVPRSLGAQHVFTAQHLHLFRPIAQGGEQVGTIELVVTLDELENRLWRYAGIAGLVLAASLLAAFGLSNQLQKLVSDPILQLAQVARTVAVDKNYSVRAAKHSNDELGQLVDGFNEMLVQIEQRDAALQAARHELEGRVTERTNELAQTNQALSVENTERKRAQAELESTHVQLLDASRRGGMAEIATNVLHNVGNVLNSVNVSAGVITESVKKSKVASLIKVVNLLREHESDLGEFLTRDARGKQVPAYLAQLADHFTAEQVAIIGELDSLRRSTSSPWWKTACA